MFTYKGVNVFYERSETGDKPVLLLHGWGGSGKTMLSLYNFLKNAGRDTVLPDLPGFGKSTPPDEDADIYYYADVIEALLDSLNIKKTDVAAHSFGGRIALILASRGFVDKLILMDSAGMKPRWNFNKWLKIQGYKLAKRKGKNLDKYGSADYIGLDKSMRKVFVRIVNEHLDFLLPTIGCRTLILWGKEDTETPIYMAKRLKKGIKGSEIIYLRGGHFAYIEDRFRTEKITEAFLCCD